MKKHIYIFFIAFIAFAKISKGQIYTVSQSIDYGTANITTAAPAAGSLTKAVIDAVNYLHSGGSVATIIIATPGLIEMKGTIKIDGANAPGNIHYPYQPYNGGTIIFKAQTPTPWQQGFTIHTGTGSGTDCEYYDVNFVYMFLINISGASSVNFPVIEFDDLIFQDFYGEKNFNNSCSGFVTGSTNSRACIYTSSPLGVKFNVKGCEFINNNTDIYFSGNGNPTIPIATSSTLTVDGTSSNPQPIFTRNSIANVYGTTLTDPSCSIFGTYFGNLVVRNGVFDFNNIPTPTGSQYQAAISISAIGNSYGNVLPNLTVQYNTLRNYTAPFIHMRDAVSTSYLNITGNWFHNTTSVYGAIYFAAGDYNSPIIDYNKFYSNTKDIVIDGGNNLLEFIKQPNPFGYAQKNYNNTFNYSNQYSNLSIKLNNYANSKVIGYPNLSEIQTANNNVPNKGSIVRGNSIVNYTGAGVISSSAMTIGSVSYTLPNPNILMANFSVSSIAPINSTINNVAADFYVSNSNKDLVSYIGSYTLDPTHISSGSGTYNNIPITIPPGLSLSCGEKIAMTLNSIDDGSNIAAGTSAASYTTIPNPTCPTAVTITPPPSVCLDEPGAFVSSSSPTSGCYDFTSSYVWNFGDGGTSTDVDPTHVFNVAGTYTVSLTLTTNIVGCSPVTNTISISVSDNCCPTCLPTFQLIPGKQYVVSGWASEANTQKSNFTVPAINLSFTTSSGTVLLGPFKPKGEVIDGWQRISENFTVPLGATAVDVILKADNSAGTDDVYFDDIRVHPFDASFKSYVYEPNTLHFVAELDDNNYATFYEYDDEGKLVRVKKETQQRIFTVKESRNSSNKK